MWARCRTVGPRDYESKWTHRELHPNLRRAKPASSCWTISPSASGSRETRTYKRLLAATCFQDRLLIRPDDFRLFKVPGVGIEPTPSWFRARRHYQQQLPRIAFKVKTRSQSASSLKKFRGQESNLRTPGSKPGITTSSDDPGVPRVPCGSRTRLASLEGWHLCRSAKGTSISAPAGGIEPPIVGLTGRRLTVGPHRSKQSGRLDLNQRSRAPEARGLSQTFPRPVR